MRRALVLLSLLWFAAPLDAQTARCKDGTTSHSTSRSGTCSGHGGVAAWGPTAKQPAVATARDDHGRISRSEAARREFMRLTGYPKGRHGYVIDHVIPLACGGADAPGNMQWQTVEAAKLKDKTERQYCH